jgi:cystathionine beta-lyase/cystathionine gamma-synthase
MIASLIRCSVGLEEPEHLQADLQRAILEVSR